METFLIKRNVEALSNVLFSDSVDKVVFSKSYDNVGRMRFELTNQINKPIEDLRKYIRDPSCITVNYRVNRQRDLPKRL